MIQKLKKLSLEQQLFISFLSLSCFLLLFSLSIAFLFSSAWKRKDIDKSLKATASYIASMDQIASMLQLGISGRVRPAGAGFPFGKFPGYQYYRRI